MTFSTTDQLNWGVISRDLNVTVGGEQIRVPGKVAQLRDDTNQVLGITSDRYTVFQNSSLRDFVAPLVEEGLLEIANIGYLGVGNKVFIQAQMTEDYTVAGENHKGMITLLNSHDGTAALSVGVTDTRVICGNTFAMAMGDMTTKLRHTMSMHDEATRITEVIDFVNERMSIYTQHAEMLASTAADLVTCDDIIAAAYNKPVENVRGANNIRKLFRSGRGNDGKTLYDAVNAVTEYTTHFAQKDAAKRHASVNFGSNALVNRRAMNAALALV